MYSQLKLSAKKKIFNKDKNNFFCYRFTDAMLVNHGFKGIMLEIGN